MTPRPAMRADCTGCRNEGFHATPRGCWSFPHAVMVPKLRLKEGEPIERAETVTAPNCYSRPGYLMLTPTSSRSVEGGDTA